MCVVCVRLCLGVDVNFFLLLCGALWDEPLEIGFMGSFLQLLEQKKKKGCVFGNNMVGIREG